MSTVSPELGSVAGGTVKVAVEGRAFTPPTRSAEPPNEPAPQLVEVTSEFPSAPVFKACRVSAVAADPVAVTVALATVPAEYVVPAACPFVDAALMAPARLARVEAMSAPIRTVSAAL